MIFLYYWFVFNFKDFFTCANYTNRQKMYFFISNILKTLRPNSSTCDITQSRGKKKDIALGVLGLLGTGAFTPPFTLAGNVHTFLLLLTMVADDLSC